MGLMCVYTQAIDQFDNQPPESQLCTSGSPLKNLTAIHRLPMNDRFHGQAIALRDCGFCAAVASFSFFGVRGE
jgi:hypothetical protein